MVHTPIQIKNLSLLLSHKTLFEEFTAQVNQGDRVGIIGRNGSGKTALLKLLSGAMEPTYGSIECADGIVFGFVPQIIEDFIALSGGQRLNKAITRALSLNPAILLLDEPTNHLDQHNRSSLLRMLESYSGTLIVISHDTELLRRCIDTIWHIDNNQINVFTGKYDDYIRERQQKRTFIEQQIIHLERKKKGIHYSLMKEQKRAAKSKAKGEKSIKQKKWPTIVSTTKAGRSQEASARKRSAIKEKKQGYIDQLSNFQLPEVITPKFTFSAANQVVRSVLTISNGSIGYQAKTPLVEKIGFTMNSGDRIAIIGDNASGKSTFIKAILNDPSVIKLGHWVIPKIVDIGYLDQHYATLSNEKTVYETIAQLMPNCSTLEIRRYLNDYLFRNNEEINETVAQLSGGEKTRLTLAQIAALTPKILILDEVTNNLDLETKEYVMQVLKNYPGAMIVISHDVDFLQDIKINDYYQIDNRQLFRI